MFVSVSKHKLTSTLALVTHQHKFTTGEKQKEKNIRSYPLSEEPKRPKLNEKLNKQKRPREIFSQRLMIALN